MPTSTTNYGLIKPGTDDPILIEQLNDNADVIDATLKSLSDAIDIAKLGIKYKGEVNYYSNLPASGNEIGDAYTVKYAGSSGTTPDGTEYVWGAVSGTNQWINFSKDSYTKAEVDALLSLKANIADIPTPSTAAPAMDGTAAAGTSTDYARADHIHPSDTSKQDALTTAQLAAANSGIDSAKVAQIETNKNNISTDKAALVELVDGGAKNIADFTSTTKTMYTTATSHGVTITRNGDIFTISGTSDTNNNLFFNIYFEGSTSTKIIPPGNWVALIEDYTGTVVNDIALQICTPTAYPADPKVYGEPIHFSLSGSESGNWLRVNLRPSTTYDGSFRLMICTKAAWDISQTYQPYRPPYQELYEQTETNENNILSKATRYILDEGNVNTNTKTFDVSNMPNGMYMITHTRFTGATTKIGVSVYMFYLLNGEIDNFTEIKAVTGATISSITATNNTATITYGDNDYHEATALYLYKN